MHKTFIICDVCGETISYDTGGWLKCGWFHNTGARNVDLCDSCIENLPSGIFPAPTKKVSP